MKILRNVLSVILTAVMALTMTYSAVLFTVRSTVTDSFVREVAENLNYAALSLPDGNGGTTTVTEVLNSSLSPLGITMTEDDVNDALRAFSVDKIAADLSSDVREWLLGDGAEPTVSSSKIAATIAANMPDTLSGLLSLFGDPEEVLDKMLSEYTSRLDLHEYFTQLEPYKPFLSEGALLIGISVTLALALLVLICRKMKVCGWLVSVGIGTFLAGICCAVLRFRLTGMRELCVSPAFEFTSPIFAQIYYVSAILITGGLALALVSAVVGSLLRSVKRAKAAQNNAPVQSHELNIPQNTSEIPAPEENHENNTSQK